MFRGGIAVFWSNVCDIFASACWIIGAVIALPVIMGCIMSLFAWGVFIAGYLAGIPFWILDKIAPSSRHSNSKEKAHE